MLKFCFAVLAFAAAVTVSISSYANPATCSEEIQRGVASWYGPGFEGSLTKSEEVFDPASLSAAHPDLPFGTVIKVTNLRNHRSVNVRVNDRGGFSKERVIDVSASAATELGMVDDGTAPVAIYRCNE